MDYAVYVAISNYLRDRTYPRDAQEDDRSSLRQRAQQYVLIQEQLYRRRGNLVDPLLEVLHEKNDFDKIQLVHEEFHLGIEGTYNNVIKKYTGHGLHQVTRNVVQDCLLCQRHNVPTFAARAEELHPIDTTRPLEIVGVDVVGPIYPPSAAGFIYIFTAIDYHTRWPIAVPAKHADVATLRNFLLQHVVAQFGVPARIVSDRGSIFTSEVINDLFRTLNVRHHVTTAYRPQANGRVERLHRTLKSLLRKLTTDDRTQWPQHLWKALLAIRTTKNTVTRFSPAKLLYGFELSLPSTWQPREDYIINNSEEDHTHQRMEEINHQVQNTRMTATNNTRRNQVRQRIRYNNTVQPRTFAINDLVMKKLNIIGNTTQRAKFSETFSGPYRVVGIIGHGAYRIEDEQGNRDTVHVDRLTTANIRRHLIPEVLAASQNLRGTAQPYRLYHQ
jgi:hypothetical protein